jgi:glycine amidinotransferase
MNPVNSYTEWGKLEEVILGSHYNATVGQLDASMELLFHDNLTRVQRKHPDYKFEVRKEYIDEREEDVAELAELLTRMGVTVRRPVALPEISDVVTPYWKAITKACDNPRDQVLVVGDRLIESACCLRNRYFENDLLKPIFYEYFEQGARWCCAPRPKLTDDSIDYSYIDSALNHPSPRFEIMFDAAQCLRFGKDILFNTSCANHKLGLQWLRRELGDAFRVHEVSLVDNHLDGGIMPLCPGKMLIANRVRDKLHLLPEPLQKWDKLFMLDVDNTRYREEDLLLASQHITVNVLSVDENHVILNDYATETIRLLEHEGFTPIPMRFRHSRVFGGGIHCVSLDIRRRESLEDYFG